jgi:protein-S-isoprenylcysteine O-methyltransferase Ste14
LNLDRHTLDGVTSREDMSAHPTKLPSLGRRGEGWVALQVCLIAAIAAAGLLGPRWPADVRPWPAVLGAVLAACGAWLLVGGGARLGRQLTPFPKPVAGGALREDGVYGLVRHPIYGGVLLLALGWSLVMSPVTLVVWAVAAAFFDAKRRREEAWLLEQHPDYEGYRQRVRRRFIPFVW